VKKKLQKKIYYIYIVSTAELRRVKKITTSIYLGLIFLVHFQERSWSLSKNLKIEVVLFTF